MHKTKYFIRLNKNITFVQLKIDLCFPYLKKII